LLVCADRLVTHTSTLVISTGLFEIGEGETILDYIKKKTQIKKEA